MSLGLLVDHAFEATLLQYSSIRNDILNYLFILYFINKWYVYRMLFLSIIYCLLWLNFERIYPDNSQYVCSGIVASICEYKTIFKVTCGTMYIEINAQTFVKCCEKLNLELSVKLKILHKQKWENIFFYNSQLTV